MIKEDRKMKKREWERRGGEKGEWRKKITE